MLLGHQGDPNLQDGAGLTALHIVFKYRSEVYDDFTARHKGA